MPSAAAAAADEAPTEMAEALEPAVAALPPITPAAPAPVTAAPEAAPAPAAAAPEPAPKVFEVQGCDTNCDYPCLKPCGQQWDECSVVAEYSGVYDLRVLENDEMMYGVLKRHVRCKGEVQLSKRPRRQQHT